MNKLPKKPHDQFQVSLHGP